MVTHFDFSNLKSFVGSERFTEQGSIENQKVWARTRASLTRQFPKLKLPQNWEIDIETWQKFRQLAPESIDNNTLRNILILQGYIALTPSQIRNNWGDDLAFIPNNGHGWSHIRVMFYRGIFGEWQEYDNGKPFARLRLPTPEIKDGGAKYLSPKNSGGNKIFWPYKLGQFSGKCEPCKVFQSSADGDDLDYAVKGRWLLTEGEDKSVISNIWGYPCIAIGGVEMWKYKKNGPINPWLMAFAMNVDKLTVIYDSDAFYKPNVVSAQSRLCRELYKHLVELAKISDSNGDVSGYCEEIWGHCEVDRLETYGATIANVHVAYGYLPPNPYSKGLDDILAVHQGGWLDTILRESPRAFEITVETPEEGKDDKNKVKAKWLFTEPRKFGLTNTKLSPVQNNCVSLIRGALSAGWLQLNHWRPVGQRQSAMTYAWDDVQQIWQLSPSKNAAIYSMRQWSELAPGRSAMDGVSGFVDAEMTNFEHISPNVGSNGHRFMGVEGRDFDVKLGQLLPIEPDHHCFSRINIRPFQGRPDKFLDFYAQRMTGGQADIERFMSFLAICIRDPGKVHILGWVTGKAGTGKSTLMKLMAKILDGWVVPEDLRNVFDSNNANKGYLPLHLLGKSLIYDDDWKGLLSTSMIGHLNKIATNTEMPFRGMSKDPILTKPNMGVLMITNEDLIMSASDVQGLPRRIQKWQFNDNRFSEDDYTLAQSLLEEEKGKILWYLLHKDLEDCAQELQAFTESEEDALERDFAVNHSAEWVECLEIWAKENLFDLTEGNHKGQSTANYANLNIGGSSHGINRLAKDSNTTDSRPADWNYLPEVFAVKVSHDAVEIIATSANWIKAIGNYEREEHNPHASHRGDRTTLKTLKSFIDTQRQISIDPRSRASIAGDRIKGWGIAFKKP